MHKAGARGKMMKGNQIIVLTVEPDERIVQSERQIALQRAEVIAELVAYVDGGCLGNPGPSGIGVVISGCTSGPVRIAKWIGHQDNNVAEYAALMEALQYALPRNPQNLHLTSTPQPSVS